ncbi:MAG TPA: sigma-54 dependent transcriptional regulator [Bryobacteraceae bacterium]|jgi:DNA-binding NtrC family response regulator|nr:sigma-54 dependent transcriptional regulator [Bryobacteraceae bacterium]
MKVLWLIDSIEDQGPVQDPVGILPDNCIAKIVGSLSEALYDLAHERQPFDACVVRLPLEDDAVTVLEELLRAKPGLPVLFLREQGPATEAVQLLKLGASHYFGANPDQEEFARVLESLPTPQPSHSAPQRVWRSILVGASPAMQQIAGMVELLAARRSTVLIYGETGSGKEMVARAIHLASTRATRPMVPVNCAAIPDTLLEAELFGHVKGAFTGATNARIGRFEQAHQSTVFLDEIGDMPIDLQSKLLRVLQEREFNRVGSPETIHVDVRVLAATNVDLLERVKEGKFREDLYYRLNVVPLRVPPLRERPEDIPALVRHFLQKICTQEHIPIKTVSTETMERLAQHSWPGNVRQLENAVEMAIVLSGDRPVLISSDFSLPSQATRKPATLNENNTISLPEGGMDFERVIGRIELNLLEQALQRAKGNKKLAAEMLGLKRTTLAAKLKSLEAAGVCG